MHMRNSPHPRMTLPSRQVKLPTSRHHVLKYSSYFTSGQTQNCPRPMSVHVSPTQTLQFQWSKLCESWAASQVWNIYLFILQNKIAQGLSKINMNFLGGEA